MDRKNAQPLRMGRHISTGAWPINDMPFELDTEMRCPFPQQLRVQREREAERRHWLAVGCSILHHNNNENTDGMR